MECIEPDSLCQGNSDMLLGIEPPPLWLVGNPFYLLRHSSHTLEVVSTLTVLCLLYETASIDSWVSKAFDFDTGECGLHAALSCPYLIQVVLVVFTWLEQGGGRSENAQNSFGSFWKAMTSYFVISLVGYLSLQTISLVRSHLLFQNTKQVIFLSSKSLACRTPYN